MIYFAVDGADELLDADSAVLMSKRSRLVETAVAQCGASHPGQASGATDGRLEGGA